MTTTNRDPLQLTGETVDGKYKMGEVIGEGGFSVVYKAEHVIWRQPVALKCFKVQNVQLDEENKRTLLEAFVQEGKLMSELSSRNSAIVQARDIGTITRPDGSWIPYMVLEWLEGRSLEELFDEMESDRSKVKPLDSCMLMLNRAAEALALAHRRGVVHRDIKPSNLFVVDGAREGEESVKVLDFGVAKVMSEHLELDKALELTTGTVTAFTPSYGAPEQFSRTHGATGPWTDVYAFALVMVEILLGGRPALLGDDFLQLALCSTNEDERPTPRTRGVQVPDEVEEVFVKALAVRPAARYGDMGEFWRALWHAVFPEQAKWTPSRPPQALSTPTSSSSKSSVGSSAVSEAAVDSDIAILDTALAPETDSETEGEALESSSSEDSACHNRDEHEREGKSTVQPLHLVQGETRNQLTPRASHGIRYAVTGAVVVTGAVAAWLVMNSRADMGVPHGSAVSTVGSQQSPSLLAPTAVSALVVSRCPKGMALVPGGKFFMGADTGPLDAWKPAHKVFVSSFCMDIHEVTAGEYKACSDVGECKRAATMSVWPRGKRESKAEHARKEKAYSELCTFGKVGFDKHPINCVSWDRARMYCEVHDKRLPSEAEWEFAARGSDGRKFPWGNEDPDSEHMNACGSECQAWRMMHGFAAGKAMYEGDDGFPGTAPVGSFPAGVTKYGMLDMVGNVFEWTADWMGPYPHEQATQRNPRGPLQGDRKVVRGGAFNGAYVSWVNPAFRYSFPPSTHSHGVGFRCAKSPGK